MEIEGGNGTTYEVDADAALVGRIWSVLPVTQQRLFEAEFAKVTADKEGSAGKQMAKLEAQKALAEAQRQQEESRRAQARLELELKLMAEAEAAGAAKVAPGMLETVTGMLGRLASPSRERAGAKKK